MKTCSTVLETKQTEELEKSVAQDLEKQDKPIKDLLDGQTKTGETK